MTINQTEIEITERTMAKALARVKRECGMDALIVRQEESHGRVTLFVRPTDHHSAEISSPQKMTGTNDTLLYVEDQPEHHHQSMLPLWAQKYKHIDHPTSDQGKDHIVTPYLTTLKSIDPKSVVTADMHTSQVIIPFTKENIQHAKPILKNHFNDTHPTNDTLGFYQDPLSAISVVCDLVDFHQLGEPLAEAWLSALNPYFSKCPISLACALSDILNFRETWIDHLTPGTGIALIGGSGSGKTSCVTKMATHLIAQGKTVQIVTMDTKTSGALQLKAYLKPLHVTVHVGSSHLKQLPPDCITLIDTPSINILNPHDYRYIQKLSTLPHIQLLVTIGADSNPLEVQDTLSTYQTIPLGGFLATRLDLTKRYGTVLRSAFGNIPLVLLSNSSKLSDGFLMPKIDILIQYMLKQWNDAQ